MARSTSSKIQSEEKKMDSHLTELFDIVTYSSKLSDSQIKRAKELISLIDAKNNAEDLYNTKKENKILFELAVENPHTFPIAEALIQSEYFPQFNCSELTPLQYIATTGGKELIQAIIASKHINKFRASFSNWRERADREPFFIALTHEHLDVAEELIKSKLCNLIREDYNRITPFQVVLLAYFEKGSYKNRDKLFVINLLLTFGELPQEQFNYLENFLEKTEKEYDQQTPDFINCLRLMVERYENKLADPSIGELTKEVWKAKLIKWKGKIADWDLVANEAARLTTLHVGEVVQNTIPLDVLKIILSYDQPKERMLFFTPDKKDEKLTMAIIHKIATFLKTKKAAENKTSDVHVEKDKKSEIGKR